MKNKKTIYKFAALSICLALASCSSEIGEATSETGTGTAEEQQYQGMECIVSPKEIINYDEIGTRSTLTPNASNGLSFAFQAGDQLTVYPASEETKAEYTLSYMMSSDQRHASFDGGGFKLKQGERYYGFITIENNLPEGSRMSGKRNIMLTYAGQRQEMNGSYYLTSPYVSLPHISKYNYLAASGLCTVEDQVGFRFQYLGSTLRVTLSGLPAGRRFKELVVYDSENTFRQPVRILNLTNSQPGSTDYVPYFDTPDMQSEEYKSAPRFSVALGPDTNNNNDTSDDEGLTVQDEGDSKGSITAFIEVPPFDFTGKQLILSLTPADGGTVWYKSITGRPVGTGKYILINQTAEEAKSFKVNIKVNHDWQHGKLSQILTRTTGDPGVKEEIEVPQYLYYIFCVNGNIKQVGGNNVNEIEGIAESQWDKGNTISTYKEQLTFSVEQSEVSLPKHLYVIASNTDLTTTGAEGYDIFDGIRTSTHTESEVQSLVYKILGTEQDVTQVFLKNLYSTPWTETNFVGDLTDPVQDVILYHTAAKFDLQWNGTEMSELSDNVGVQGVQDTGLSLFKPTQNGASPSFTGTANYSVQTPITKGTRYQGRTVYYLPQMQPSACRYNIYIGGNGTANETITFTPNVDGGFTSWLRGQVVGETPEP